MGSPLVGARPLNQDWLPASDGGESAAATFEDGLLSLAVIHAAQRSARVGGWERVHATV